MRTLNVPEFMTLDGVVEEPGGKPTHPHSGSTMPYGVADRYADKLQETLEAGSLLVRTLLAHGLVDELRLMAYPVVIGGGLRIFPDERAKIELEPADLVRYDSGVLLQMYRPAA